MSNPASASPHHTPQQHGRHRDYEGATEPLGPGEGQRASNAAPPRHEGVENPPDAETQPDGFGEPDEPEHSNNEDGSQSAHPAKRRPTKSPAPSDPMR